MKYDIFSSYWVIDRIKSGKRVLVLDRKAKSIDVVNDMTVDKMLAVLNSAKEDSDRYEFWTEEEEKDA